MKRTLTIPVVVLIAVVALVVGSFGSATAASLTKAQVKKIAAKVVNSKATSLTVAKAATADTATTATTAGTVSDNAITSGKIANGSITKDDLATGVVPTILTARVSSAGELTLSSGAVSATRVSLGIYDVTFNRTVAQCTHLVTIFGGNQADDFVTETSTVGAVVRVDLESPDTAGTQIDQGFALAVIC